MIGRCGATGQQCVALFYHIKKNGEIREDLEHPCKDCELEDLGGKS